MLHYNDGRAGRNLNTLCIMGRRYFDRFGWIYNPAYKSVYVDDEFMKVSESLGKSTYVDEVLIAHKWTDVTGRDALHMRNEASALYQADARTFETRKAAGFP